MLIKRNNISKYLFYKNKISFNKYCKNIFYFYKQIKYILFISNLKFLKKRYSKVRRIGLIKRKGKIYKWWNFFFLFDLYNIYFFYLWRKRKVQGKYLNIIKNKFFFIEVKNSLNNLFINVYVVNKGIRKLIYCLSSGMVFQNSAKSLIYASIRLSDVLTGFVKLKKIKNFVVFLYGLDYKIIKFFKLFGKNKKEFNILFFIFRLKFVFNGVRYKKKRRK